MNSDNSAVRPSSRTPQPVAATETPGQASLRALKADLDAAGVSQSDYNIIARGSEIQIYVDGDRMSEVAPKIRGVFDAAGFGKVVARSPYTGYDQSYPIDSNGVRYEILRDEKVRAMGGALGGVW
jgi:hypothetical protein